MIWFSSDWHLGHKNISGAPKSNWTSGYRNFNSVEEMDKTIVDTMNEYMDWGDILYYLGDLCMESGKRVAEYRSRILVESFHFVKGNHDKWTKGINYHPSFSSMQDVCKFSHEGQTFFLSHYGHRVWPHSHKGCIHLYGHSHSNLPAYGKSMDVGVDNAYVMYKEWRPFSYLEIVDIMSKREMELPDHHGHRGED
jgi:calcineurin-like phosphoesterase family protein